MVNLTAPSTTPGLYFPVEAEGFGRLAGSSVGERVRAIDGVLLAAHRRMAT